MADPTIKVKDETRTELLELQREYGFGSMDELQRHLSSLAKAEKISASVSELAPAIQAVQELSLRLISVLTGTGDSLLTAKEKQVEVLAQQEESFAKTRELLQSRITDLEQELADINIEAVQAENTRLKLELEAVKQSKTGSELAHEKALLELEKNLTMKHVAETAQLIAEFKKPFTVAN
ncbi:MAG: hypothetical protein FWB87_15770 [Defluviitaleaceae bacterium]|nr:hypothetical protein [Defluviitaleaceae bacterium]